MTRIAREFKLLSITVSKELADLLTEVKEEYFRDCTWGEMFRALIAAGLRASRPKPWKMRIVPGIPMWC